LISHSLTLFFLQLFFMLSVALVCGQILDKIGQPQILGELLGGIIIGPNILGLIFPDAYKTIFPNNINLSIELNSFIQFGMLLFMFISGLEVNVASAFHKRKPIALISIFEILIPFSLGLFLVYLFPQIKEGSSVNLVIFSIFLGVALSFSALPIILRILQDLKIGSTDIGIIIISVAVISDLTGWLIFTILINLNDASSNLGATIFFTIFKILFFCIFVIYFIPKAAGFIIRFLRNFKIKTISYIGLILTTILGVAGLAELIGVHPFFAIFLLGIVLRKFFIINGTKIKEFFREMVICFFAPLYFVSIGLKIDFLHDVNLLIIGVILLASFASKILGAGLGAYLSGLKFNKSIAIGISLNARGAMGIVIASLGLEYKIIGQELYVALVIMSLVTSLISSPILKGLSKHDDFSILRH